MSRTGKLPVEIPSNVKAKVEGTTVTIDGPKGSLTRTFREVEIEMAEGAITVKPASRSRLSRAMWGTARSTINGMVEGVDKGFEKNLELHGTGFKAALKGDVLDLALGFSHPVNYKVPAGITVTVAENTKIKVQGADKHMVGQVTADIYHFRKVEPYKGKGVRIVGQFFRRKEGKKAAK